VKAVLLRHLTRLVSSHPILSRSVQENMFLPKTNALAFPFFNDEVAYHFSDNLYCKLLMYLQNLCHYRCDSREPIIWLLFLYLITFLYYNDVSPSNIPPGAAPVPTLCPHCLVYPLRTFVVQVSVLLVSWSIICCQDGYFMVNQRLITEEYLSHNLDEHCLWDTRVIWCLSNPSGGAPFSGRYVSW